MKKIAILNLGAILLVLFFFVSCTKTLSEEQKATEKQIMVFFTRMDEALARQDWTELYKIVNDYFAEDIIIRAEDPNREGQKTQVINLQQYRFILQRTSQVILDYKRDYINRTIDIAPDGKSATVTYSHLETFTLRKEVAVMFAGYLFKNEDMASVEPHVTLRNEEQIMMKFDYREDSLFVTQIDSKITKMELL